MNLTANSVLIPALAMQDAIFTPVRGFDTSLPSTIQTLRERFPEQGIQYRPRSKDLAEQKADQREFDALSDAGFVKVFRGKAGRANALQLTDAGEEAVRSLCSLPTLADSILALQHIAGLVKAGRCSTHRGMALVSESTIQRVAYGTPGAEESFARLQDFLFPALARGWVESHATTEGHVCYEITEAGRSALASAKRPAKAKSRPGNRNALRAYDVAYGRALDLLRSMTPPDPQEIGPMPIPPEAVADWKEADPD